jgi:hypothetical protein
MASMPSSTVMSGVVFMALMAPPAAAAMEAAHAVALSGSSAITTESYSPNAK